MTFSEESIPLVVTDQNNQFSLTTQAKQLLLSISKPIAIVTIAGMYRTGKSYLINRLLKNKQNGFKIGSTTQSCTKGLNLWGRPIPAEDEEGNQMYYIVIDSEGIGSCQQQVKYDMKLMMLVFLISSTVVYNSMGAIDQLALDQLRVVLNLKNTLASQPPKQKTRFVWILRDFALQLIDKNGYQMSANEYLEQCLEEGPGLGSDARKKNQIRKAIKEGLGKRTCFTLVRPTINQEDLADLAKCKLRTEFVNQIELIREEVFSGSNSDLKRISGRTINGKLLIGLLQECVHVLNSNGLPEIGTIWESVKQVADEQSFEDIRKQMKREVQKIGLPVSKEDLKCRLNQIQNKFYNRLQNTFQDYSSFKKYHKEYLRQLQKINKQVKKNNCQILKDKVLKQIRQFVKINISYQNIEPTNLSLVKVLVDRMELKTKGQTEGYEYVLSVLYDLMHISEQKAILMQRQLYEQRKLAELGSMERKNSDMSIIALKQDYHQSLKTINNLKLTQQETEKQLALVRHQHQILTITLKNNQQQNQLKQSNLIRQVEEMSFKNKQRNDETAQTIKRLREENSQLEGQIQSLKQQKLREGLNERKQIIFEQKMKQTWDKFDEERTFFRNQMFKLRNQVETYIKKYQEQRRYRQKEVEQFSKDREAYLSKERQFVQQLRQMKTLHAQAKKTYSATFDAMKDNDRVFRNIQNITLSNSKLTSCKKQPQTMNDEKQIAIIRKNYQLQINKAKSQHQDEVKYLNSELTRINKMYEQLRTRSGERDQQLKECLEQKNKLQIQLMTSNQRFADTVSQIEIAKERERSLYEESIVRLLSNMDKSVSYSSTRR